MNSQAKRWLWRCIKTAIAVLVLVFVGRRFAADMGGLDLDALSLQPSWLLACNLLYLAAIFPSIWYWRHIQDLFGYPVPLLAGVRASYIAQLGKYVPGKAVVIAIRCEMVHPYGVPYGVTIITTFYEVFTSMAGYLPALRLSYGE